MKKSIRNHPTNKIASPYLQSIRDSKVFWWKRTLSAVDFRRRRLARILRYHFAKTRRGKANCLWKIWLNIHNQLNSKVLILLGPALDPFLYFQFGLKKFAPKYPFLSPLHGFGSAYFHHLLPSFRRYTAQTDTGNAFLQKSQVHRTVNMVDLKSGWNT